MSEFFKRLSRTLTPTVKKRKAIDKMEEDIPHLVVVEEQLSSSSSVMTPSMSSASSPLSTSTSSSPLSSSLLLGHCPHGDTVGGATQTPWGEEEPVVTAGSTIGKRRRKKVISKNDVELVDITCIVNTDSTLIKVSPNITVPGLLTVIQKEFNATVCIGEMKFKDEDGDLITISKSSDLDVFFELSDLVLYVVKPPEHTHIRARSAPDEFLNNHINNQNGDTSNGRSSIHRSLPSRKFSMGHEDELIRRIKTTPEAPWIPGGGGGVISPFDLVIPEHIRPLGRGFFGEVRVGYLHGQQVACKILFGKSFKNKTENDLFTREISILSELRHANIITYLGTCTEQNRKIIVMEYMSLGCLHEYLLNQPTVPTYDILLKIVKDVAVGMQFLHDHKVLHRDFNSKNILLNRDMVAKVADFGLSKKLENSTLSYTMGQVPWMAPEVIEYSKNYSHKSDVYSFGILLWEMVSRGQSPCPPTLSYVSMANKVLHEQWRPEIPPGIPEHWTKLIQICWAQHPSTRPSFSDILKLVPSIAIPLSEYPPPPPPPSTSQFPPSVPSPPSGIPPTNDQMDEYHAEY